MSRKKLAEEVSKRIFAGCAGRINNKNPLLRKPLSKQAHITSYVSLLFFFDVFFIFFFVCASSSLNIYIYVVYSYLCTVLHGCGECFFYSSFRR